MQKLSIITNRLIIRNLVITDLDNFHQYRSNPEVTKYQGFDVMTKEACANFINSQLEKQFGKAGEWVQYAIENKETKQLIGDCAIKLDQDDIRLAEVGMTISDLHQKKGYAKEALTGILDWLFETQNIHRVTEIVDAENVASIHLLKSLNFKQEGHFKENIFFKGKWGSEFQFALLKREWKTL
jgi:[ribosomal protein S5]-alanine N-acetyltransferase